MRKQKLKHETLNFQAIKYKYVEDEDGEATIILKVSMKDKLIAFAVPTKELLNVKVRRADG